MSFHAAFLTPDISKGRIDIGIGWYSRRKYRYGIRTENIVLGQRSAAIVSGPRCTAAATKAKDGSFREPPRLFTEVFTDHDACLWSETTSTGWLELFECHNNHKAGTRPILNIPNIQNLYLVSFQLAYLVRTTTSWVFLCLLPPVEKKFSILFLARDNLSNWMIDWADESRCSCTIHVRGVALGRAQ